MGLHGKKRWEESGGVMPMRVIARRIGVTERTAWNIYGRAVRKLKRLPGRFELLLPLLQASAALRVEVLRAGSAECDAEFRTKGIL